MPNFWDYFGKGSSPKHLQDGLFQIASQTCNLLVQVNNTNNISYGNNSMNISCNTIPTQSSTSNLQSNDCNLSQDQEQLLVLIPPVVGGKGARFKQTGTIRKPRLSTVLEGTVLNHEEVTDLWNQGYNLPVDNDGSPRRWGKKGQWCRPSCIPISFILILIFLVVLLPLLDHATEKALQILNFSTKNSCNSSCRISLVESIPNGMIYANGTTPYPSTYDTWMNLINNAQNSIEIASLYWTLRSSDVVPDASSEEGNMVFQALLNAGTKRQIKIRIAQNEPTQYQPNIDTEILTKRKAAEVRSLNFAKLLGAGVLHSKLWIVDRKHFYVGSANMDWRSLTQVKELGFVAYNCSCLVEDIAKVFDVYWLLGEPSAKIPNVWPPVLDTKYNVHSPMNLTISNNSYQAYIASSPPSFCPNGRTTDIEAILNVIENAEKFIYIAVMDYFPLTIYTSKIKFWPVIDNALRTAAVDHRVKIKMLISWWNHSRSSEDYFLKSLQDVTNSYPKVSIEIKRFIVPTSNEQRHIPFARVNHNKYMVTDNTAYIGTSNWSGDYFINTAGIGLIFHDPNVFNNDPEFYDEMFSTNVRNELQAVFERDWNSNFTHPIDF